MRRLAVGVALIACSIVTGVSSPSARAEGATIIHGECAVGGLPGYEGLVFGRGHLVITPSGQVVSVCGLRLVPPPEDTTVQKFPGGNIVVMARGGRAIVVFTPCGPSNPC